MELVSLSNLSPIKGKMLIKCGGVEAGECEILTEQVGPIQTRPPSSSPFLTGLSAPFIHPQPSCSPPPSPRPLSASNPTSTPFALPRLFSASTSDAPSPSSLVFGTAPLASRASVKKPKIEDSKEKSALEQTQAKERDIRVSRDSKLVRGFWFLIFFDWIVFHINLSSIPPTKEKKTEKLICNLLVGAVHLAHREVDRAVLPHLFLLSLLLVPRLDVLWSDEIDGLDNGLGYDGASVGSSETDMDFYQIENPTRQEPPLPPPGVIRLFQMLAARPGLGIRRGGKTILTLSNILHPSEEKWHRILKLDPLSYIIQSLRFLTVSLSCLILIAV